MITTAIQFIRSLLFSIGMILVTGIYGIICPLFIVLPFRRRYQLVIAWSRFIIWYAKITVGIRYNVIGMENIPDENGIVMSKHQSTWETCFLTSLFPHTTFVVKHELLRIPFYGWGLALLRPIAINRSNTKSAMAQLIEQGKKHLALGDWVLLFPEGTRTAPGKVGQYRKGGALLAAETGKAVTPIAHNAGYFWPRRGFMKTPGTITLVIGKPIPTQGRKAEAILSDVKHWIETTMVEIKGP